MDMQRKEMTSEELKRCQMDILNVLDAFCKEHNIRYWLCYGTLIGTIRHQGFIPWDDDIDVYMPRPDYERFCQLFPSNEGRYRVKNLNLDKSYYALPFAKLIDTETVLVEKLSDSVEGMGVNVDIFQLDGLGNDKAEAEKRIMKGRTLMRWMYLCNMHYKKGNTPFIWARNAMVWLMHVLKCKMVPFRAMERLGKKSAYEDSKYVGMLVGTYGKGEALERAWFDETVIKPFEDGAYPVPAGYDCVLRNIYGDYMKLPPEEKQVTHHSFRAYFREENPEA